MPLTPLSPADLARFRELAAERVRSSPGDPLAQAVFVLCDEVDRQAAAMAAVRACLTDLGDVPKGDDGPWGHATTAGLGFVLGALVVLPFALGVA